MTEFRSILETCDVAAARRAWGMIAPGAPQPESDEEALASIHYARTVAVSIALRWRAYSHRWLLDHGLPSGLPDAMKPAAERMYPRIVVGVGIAVRPLSAGRVDHARAIQDAMSLAVEECFADGQTDPAFLRARMALARRKLLAQ